MKYKPLLEKIKKEVDKAKIISFDVFDTLLLRPYLEPADLFLHIEKVKNVPSFCAYRTEAELEVRRKNPMREDITYDEIYEEIEEDFKSLKQFELDWEMMVLTQNPEMKQVWDYAKTMGKKIIVASDMYLPANFIALALKKNGFDNYDKIYVSGDLGKTKFIGTMYKHMIEELQAIPSDILHIGDNKHSDYKKPQEYKIPSIVYKQVKSQYFHWYKQIDLFINELGRNLGASIFIMLFAMRWQKKMLGLIQSDYWNDIGYEYAGPIAYGYNRFVESQVKQNGIKQILFVARDGYTLQKVFDTFENDIKTDYVYAPRFLNLICRLDYVHKDKKQTCAIIDYYADKNSELKKLYESTTFKKPIDYHIFISNNRKLIEEMANKELHYYENYLSKIAPKYKKICIVETVTTGIFSSQRLIQNTLKCQTLGIYWSILKSYSQSIYEHNSFIENSGSDFTDIFTKNWNFVEFLLTAPEFPIKNIAENGEPVYDPNPIDHEKTRKNLYPSVSSGAMLFAEDVKKMFCGNDIFLEPRVLVKWVNCFCDNPTKTDIKKMAVLYHSGDSDHRTYLPLFSTQIPLAYALHHPKKTIEEIKSTIWRTKLQTVALCLKSPIRVKVNKIRQLRISLLPRLQNRFFTVQLKFGSKWLYQISVGSEKDEK